MNLLRLPSSVSANQRHPNRVPANPPAYAIPWSVVQCDPDGTVEVLNVGQERLRFVRFSVVGAGLLGMSLPVAVEVDESLSVQVRGIAASPEGLLILRWFRPSGGEYLWSIAL